MSEETAVVDTTASMIEHEAEEETPEFLPSNFNISIHYDLTNAQNEHGLRHDDYAQYHSYLSRRISRLRHAKGVRKNLTHYGSYKGGAGAETQVGSLADATSSGVAATKSGQKVGKHAFHSRPRWSGSQANEHKNYLLVELYSAERAWAHAMELKGAYDAMVSTSSTASKKLFSSGSKTSPGKLRHHYLRRLKKASSFAENLEKMVSERTGICNERTCMEIKAYSAWMRGNWFCETEKWKNACQEYAMALNLCEALAKDTEILGDSSLPNDTSTSKATKTTAEALQLSDFFHKRATNVLQPLLRYCQYELQQEGILDQDEIAALTEEAINTSTNTMNEYVQAKLNAIKESELQRLAASTGGDDSNVTIEFRDKTILVENTSLRVVMLKLQQAKKELSQTSSSTSIPSSKAVSNRDSKFLELLNLYDDALSIVSDMHNEYLGMTSGPSVNKKRFESEILLGYFKFCKIEALMQRNEKMVDALRDEDRDESSTRRNTNGKDDPDMKYKRVEEIAHLYDSLLQDAQTVAKLPGGGDSADEDKEDIEDDFVMEASANVLRIRSLRCYYVGRMYASDTVAKYAEALALYSQALNLASEAAEEMAAIDKDINALLDLEQEITKERCRAKASAFLALSGSGASSATTGLPLVRRLDDYDSGGKTYNIASSPPALEPIPCKPAFFDIAHSHVTEFPLEDLQHHVNAHHLQSKGFLRWFRKS